MASEEVPETDRKFETGTVVWARIQGFPSWPGFIEDDPDHKTACGEDDDGNTIYHVTFFGNPVSRAWVDEDDIQEYTHVDDIASYKKRIPKKGKVSIEEALKQANYAVRQCYEELFDMFGFNKRVVKRAEGTPDSGRLKGGAKRKSITKGEKPSPGDGRSGENAKTASRSFQIESPLAQEPTSSRKSGARGKEEETPVENIRQRKRSLPYEDIEKDGAKKAIGSDKDV